MHAACARVRVCASVKGSGEELLKPLCIQAPPTHSHPRPSERTTWLGLSAWTSRITAKQYKPFELSTGEVVFALFYSVAFGATPHGTQLDTPLPVPWPITHSTPRGVNWPLIDCIFTTRGLDAHRILNTLTTRGFPDCYLNICTICSTIRSFLAGKETQQPPRTLLNSYNYFVKEVTFTSSDYHGKWNYRSHYQTAGNKSQKETVPERKYSTTWLRNT